MKLQAARIARATAAARWIVRRASRPRAAFLEAPGRYRIGAEVFDRAGYLAAVTELEGRGIAVVLIGDDASDETARLAPVFIAGGVLRGPRMTPEEWGIRAIAQQAASFEFERNFER